MLLRILPALGLFACVAGATPPPDPTGRPATALDRLSWLEGTWGS